MNNEIKYFTQNYLKYLNHRHPMEYNSISFKII